jgi:C_GCAxxG_C_C family probable redox protein
LAVCQEFELGSNHDVVSSGIALGFAGGIGSTGSVCGAVAGAVMAIGLVLGRGQTMGDMLSRSGVVQEFRRRFEVEMEHITCRELTGMDLTTQEGRVKYMGSDIPQKVCFPAVGAAYRLVVDLLKESFVARTLQA